MRTKNKIDWELANECFVVDRKVESGLIWKKGSGRHYSGEMAGYLTSSGYWTVFWRKKHYYAHRIIWAIQNKSDPGSIEVKRK